MDQLKEIIYRWLTAYLEKTGFILYGKSSPSPPPPPNPAAVGQAQSSSNIATAQAQAQLSNPNVTSPLGSQTVTFGSPGGFDQQGFNQAQQQYQQQLAAYNAAGGSNQQQFSTGLNGGIGAGIFGQQGGGQRPNPNLVPLPQAPTQAQFTNSGNVAQPNVNIQLSPTEQQLFNQQQQQQLGISATANQVIPQVQQAMSQPVQAPNPQTATDAYYNQQKAFLDPQWQQQDQATKSALVNQGLTPGGEAYNNAWGNEQRAKDFAYNQAQQGAILQGPQNAQQRFQLGAAEQTLPLNQLTALMSGSQAQMPQFSAYNPSNVSPTPVGQYAYGSYGGLQDIYNQQIGQQNATTSGLYGLGGSLGAMGMLALAASDRRLKSNIKRIGTHNLGIGIYEYDIFGHHDIGVMADEVEKVRPWAVVRINGVMMVDYWKL